MLMEGRGRVDLAAEYTRYGIGKLEVRREELASDAADGDHLLPLQLSKSSSSAAAAEHEAEAAVCARSVLRRVTSLKSCDLTRLNMRAQNTSVEMGENHQELR
jgi:hypothetical protein